jgi:CubicO group peptidase (beta-lactamase class C family)
MATISRGEGPHVPWAAGESLQVEGLVVDDGTGASLPITEIWRRTGVDSTLVLHRGKIVFEHYQGDMNATIRHAMFSCTKSVVGLLVESLIHEGAIDPQAKARTYIGELADSPAGRASVRQLLDMEAHFMFSDAPKVDGQVQVDYLMGLGLMPRTPDYQGPNGVYEVLERARPMGEHGGYFRYDNGSTDTLGWILRRVTGLDLNQLISQSLWSKLGCEQDALMTLDSTGVEWAGGGMASRLRDFVRLGEMLRGHGQFNGQQILAPEVYSGLYQGGDPATFAAGAAVPVGGSYRSQFWFNHDRHQSFGMRGQYGQRVWIAPKAEVVIAQFAADTHLAALEPLRLRGFQGIADLYL